MPGSQCDPGGEAGLKEERKPEHLEPFTCCWWAGDSPTVPLPTPALAGAPLLWLRPGKNGTTEGRAIYSGEQK